jgi:hypothetical protein
MHDYALLPELPSTHAHALDFIKFAIRKVKEAEKEAEGYSKVTAVLEQQVSDRRTATLEAAPRCKCNRPTSSVPSAHGGVFWCCRSVEVSAPEEEHLRMSEVCDFFQYPGCAPNTYPDISSFPVCAKSTIASSATTLTS